jgi:hypothetical protein
MGLNVDWEVFDAEIVGYSFELIPYAVGEAGVYD